VGWAAHFAAVQWPEEGWPNPEACRGQLVAAIDMARALKDKTSPVCQARQRRDTTVASLGIGRSQDEPPGPVTQGATTSRRGLRLGQLV
jgi:hypothetical protein